MPDSNVCEKCGAPKLLWAETSGVAAADGTRCCQPCADGAECECAARAPTKEEIRDDPASGRLIQSLRHQTDTMTTADYDRGLVRKPSAGSGGPD